MRNSFYTWRADQPSQPARQEATTTEFDGPERELLEFYRSAYRDNIAKEQSEVRSMSVVLPILRTSVG